MKNLIQTLLVSMAFVVGGVSQASEIKVGDSVDTVLSVLGPPPAHETPNDPQNQRAIDAYLKLCVDDLRPDVTILWLNDPDGTAHANGIGAPLTRKSLTLVDGGIGRIEDGLRARGLLDATNILVTSDHGFSTETGELNLPKLVEPFAKTLDDGTKDIVVAEGAIHLRTPDQPRVEAIVRLLQQRPEVGAIFTKSRVPGTLPFDAARWNHARSGDILVSANWSDTANAAGFKGTTTQEGVAGHGTSSPYDIHNTLIAAGPEFREHATSGVPTANVDLAPTLLRLLGIAPPSSMTGRVIEEGFRGAAPALPRREGRETVSSVGGKYTLTAHFSFVGDYRYLDYTEVTRR